MRAVESGLRCEAKAERGRKSTTPEYRAWQSAITRCGNPRLLEFTNYGGRGIRVCEEWRHDFARFLADMGERPSAGHSLDRIDNDGPYSKANCRWATSDQRRNNTRRNVYVTFRGETRSVSQWARVVGISRFSMRQRFARWGVERALTTPVPAKFGGLS